MEAPKLKKGSSFVLNYMHGLQEKDWDMIFHIRTQRLDEGCWSYSLCSEYEKRGNVFGDVKAE